ncbi:MAG: hypothetical protein ACERKV_09970 [Clostridiaceae bacterium]
MKKINLLVLSLCTSMFFLIGCGKVQVVEGVFNEKASFDNQDITTTNTEVFDWLVSTEEGYNTEVIFEENSKPVLINITLNTGDEIIGNQNFKLESKSGEETISSEAIPSDLEYHEKYNIINFNTNSSGLVQGNLLFSVNENDIANNNFTLKIELEKVIFEIPISINYKDTQIYSLGDTVTIDGDYEICFKNVQTSTSELKYKGTTVDLGANKMVFLETDIHLLNTLEIMITPEDLNFVDDEGDLYYVDSDSYDNYPSFINQEITEDTTKYVAIMIPEGKELSDFTFFIKTPFSKTDWCLTK